MANTRILFLAAASCSLTFPSVSLVRNFVCGQKLLDLIDCKVSAIGRARQLISLCLTAYIRRITSEGTGKPTEIYHVRKTATIYDLHEAQLQ